MSGCPCFATIDDALQMAGLRVGVLEEEPFFGYDWPNRPAWLFAVLVGGAAIGVETMTAIIV